MGSHILRVSKRDKAIARLLSPPLTWSLVPRGTKAVRARQPPCASMWVVARQDVVAFGRCAPVAPVNVERFQGETRFLGRSVLQWRLACGGDVTVFDGAAGALVPSGAVEAHRLKARPFSLPVYFKVKVKPTHLSFSAKGALNFNSVSNRARASRGKYDRKYFHRHVWYHELEGSQAS